MACCVIWWYTCAIWKTAAVAKANVLLFTAVEHADNVDECTIWTG